MKGNRLGKKLQVMAVLLVGLAILFLQDERNVLAGGPLVLKDNYPGLEIPMTEYGFRGMGEDGTGRLYLSALLMNGVYLFPRGCLKQDCANFVKLSPPLSDPGKIVGLPGGGAFVLLRLADRIDYIPANCGSDECVRAILLPRRPSYPSGGVVNRSTGTVWVTEQLAGQISRIPKGCFHASCMTSIGLPSRGPGPSGISRDPGKGFWITERNADRIAFLPDGCRTTACIHEYSIPYQGSSLHPFSPVTLANGMIAFLLKGGRVIGIGQLENQGMIFHFISIGKEVGRVRTILSGPNQNLILVAAGAYPHVGHLTLTRTCLEKQDNAGTGCLDLRIIPIANGEPFGLYPGRKGHYWITLRNLDTVVRFRLTPKHCMNSGKTLLPACYRTVAFSRQETLYHKKYHQEVSH